MVYTVTFDPTDADYKILKKRGIAFDRNIYPIVSKSGFQSREEAQGYIEAGPGGARRTGHAATYALIPETLLRRGTGG
jgi:hypothetical protein